MNKDLFWVLNQCKRLSVIDNDNRKTEMIFFSYSNMEQIVNKFLFPALHNQSFCWVNLLHNPLSKFLEIYFSSICESFLDDEQSFVNNRNLYPSIWKFEESENYSFHDCLFNVVLSQHWTEKKKIYVNDIGWTTEIMGEKWLLSIFTPVEKSKRELQNKKREEALSKIIKDKEVVKFLISLASNLSGYKSNNFSKIGLSQHNGKLLHSGNETEVVKNVKELFQLLQDSKELIAPYLKGSGLKKFFYSNLPTEKFLEDLIFGVIRFKKTSKFISWFILENVLRNQRISCFAERNNVFYRVIGFGSESFFNQKKEVIFPSASEEDLISKSSQMLKPKFQNLTIFNHNSKAEELFTEPTNIWLDARELLKALAEEFISDTKVLKKVQSCNTVQEATGAISAVISLTKKPEAFRVFLKGELETNPNPLPLKSKSGNSYLKIAKEQYGIGEGSFNKICQQVRSSMTKNIPIKAGRPSKKS